VFVGGRKVCGVDDDEDDDEPRRHEEMKDHEGLF